MNPNPNPDPSLRRNAPEASPQAEGPDPSSTHRGLGYQSSRSGSVSRPQGLDACGSHIHLIPGFGVGCAFATAVAEAFEAVANQHPFEAALHAHRVDMIVRSLDDCHDTEILGDFISGLACALGRILEAHDD